MYAKCVLNAKQIQPLNCSLLINCFQHLNERITLLESIKPFVKGKKRVRTKTRTLLDLIAYSLFSFTWVHIISKKHILELFSFAAR